MNEHQRAAIRDPHNAAYHEARGEIDELRAEVERLRSWVAYLCGAQADGRDMATYHTHILNGAAPFIAPPST